MSDFKPPLGSILDSITQFTTMHQKRTQLQIMQNKDRFLGYLRMMATVMEKGNISQPKCITDMVQTFDRAVTEDPGNARGAFEQLGNSLMVHAGRDIDLCTNPETLPYLKNFLRESLNVSESAGNAVLTKQYTRIALFIKEVGEIEATDKGDIATESIGASS